MASVHPLVAVAVVLASFAAPGRALAGCGSPGSICRALEGADAVFSGQVVSISRLDYQPAGMSGAIPSRKAHFQIERAWKGLPGFDTVDVVMLGAPPETWVEDEYDFVVGKRYLVYATRPPGGYQLRTGACTRTQALSDAGLDLEYLASLSVAGPRALIYGKLWRNEGSIVAGAWNPGVLAERSVLLSGAGVRLETRSDPQGRYAFRDLQPGRYEISVVLPARVLPGQPGAGSPVPPAASSRRMIRSVTIEGDHGCAEADFWSYSDTRIAGFVTVNGRRAAGVRIQVADAREVARADRQREQRPAGDSMPFAPITLDTVTGADGSFRFVGLPAGRYFLGSGLGGLTPPGDAKNRILCPGTTQAAEARTIELGLGQHINVGECRLPAPPSK